MRLLFIRIIYFMCFGGLFFCTEKGRNTTRESYTVSGDTSEGAGVNFMKLQKKAKEALAFSEVNNLNTKVCILIDMSVHSGLKRFFVWSFEQDTILNSFLVSHGCCSNPWNSDASKEAPEFSNKEGSHCSSLGKYKIGERGYSNWGVNIKYLLHGFESTNNNALARQIVFHSWEEVSDTEVFPKGTPEGWGCPAISNHAMQTVDQILKPSKMPVLMWIYEK